MKVDTAFLQDRYNKFNNEIFESKLPTISLAICHTRGKLGYFSYKSLFDRTNGDKHTLDLSIRLSSCFDLPEEEWEDVLIHEMIHFFLHVAGIKDTSPHGKYFKKVMNEINQRFGRHIVISSRKKMISNERPHRKNHLFAVIHFKDGTIGLKVLTHTQSKLIAYHRALCNAPKVDSLSYYCSNNVFFDAFPHSISLRYHPITEEEIAPHIKSARMVIFDGLQFRVVSDCNDTL